MSKAWRFSTEEVSKSQRVSAWRDAVARLNLPTGDIENEDDFQGQIDCLVSPLGIRLAVVEASAQKIGDDYPKQADALWLGVLLEGAARLNYRDERINLKTGDMIYGMTGGAKASLVFETRFRQIFINAPAPILNERFIAPLSQRLGYLPADGGVRRVFSDVLVAIANEIDELEDDQLRLLDHSFMEYLIACAIDESRVSLAADPYSVCTDNLHRFCQTIELLLHDLTLTPAKVAEAHGVSTRYLQESFAKVGRSFPDYVRKRRLERCRGDLTSPLFAQQSISEICYRWGFGTPARFSRAFRKMYGLPPREYRRQHTTTYTEKTE